MADKPVVAHWRKFRRRSCEPMRLLQDVLQAEAPQKPSRKLILDAYAECLTATTHPHSRKSAGNKKLDKPRDNMFVEG